MAAELQAKKAQSQGEPIITDTISEGKITQAHSDISSSKTVQEDKEEAINKEIIPKHKKIFLGSGKLHTPDSNEAKPKSVEKKLIIGKIVHLLNSVKSMGSKTKILTKIRDLKSSGIKNN